MIEQLLLTDYSNIYFSTLYSLKTSAFIMNSASFINLDDLELIFSDSSNMTFVNISIINSRFNEIETSIFIFIGNQFSNIQFSNFSFVNNTAANLSAIYFFNGSYQNISLDSLNFSDNLADLTIFISFNENKNCFLYFVRFLIFYNDNSSKNFIIIF